MIPVLIGVLTSYAVANSIAISIYDVILQLKNLPFLPNLISDDTYSKNVGDIMTSKFLYLPSGSKLSDIPAILNKVGKKPATIPVVDSRKQKTLLCTIQAQALKKYLIATFNKASRNMDPEVKKHLANYFYALQKIGVEQQTDFIMNVVVDPMKILKASAMDKSLDLD